MGDESEERHRADREAVAARMRADAEAERKRQEAEHRRVMDEHHRRQLQEIENRQRAARQTQPKPSSQNQATPHKRKQSSFKIFLSISFQIIVVFIAWAVFFYSFTLKAYSDLTGFECAKQCLTKIPFEAEIGLWRIYYFTFNVVNLLFGLSPIIVFAQIISGNYFKKIKWIYILALIQLVSWPAIHILHGGPPPEHDAPLKEIHSGYYVWLLSTIITTASVFSLSKIDNSRY